LRGSHAHCNIGFDEIMDLACLKAEAAPKQKAEAQAENGFDWILSAVSATYL
jgi:hypothetical protein